jgi:endonuclease III
MDEDRQAYIENINQVRNRLIEAYGMPEWRQPLPAVDELVSTILSQNTNDTNRDAAFEQLRAAFPDWNAVMAGRYSRCCGSHSNRWIGQPERPQDPGCAAMRSLNSPKGDLNLDFLM